MIALDASALLAWLFTEEGHETVAPHLSQSRISAINLSEVLGRIARVGDDAGALHHLIGRTTLEVVPFAAEDALLAAELIPATAALGLSLGDRACLALAKRHAIPAITADRAWAKLDLGITIQVIR
ncbi:MAG: type II toxin-antitoxin system VapC family toxin [Deltaproteobacteria bacterium]